MSKRELEDDARLVRAIETGDQHAASLLWRRHAPMVVRMLRRALGGSVDVEDLAQEVFLIVFHKLRRLRTPTSLKAFIIAVAVRICLQQRRRLSVRQQTPPPEWETSDRELVAREVEARIALSRLLTVLGRVSPTDRTATMLRYLELRRLTDIASALDVSLATVKRRIARGSAKVALLAERDPFLAPYSVIGQRRSAAVRAAVPDPLRTA
jgi:RNA polymerase sigma-70 factor (ECF subfamily)